MNTMTTLLNPIGFSIPSALDYAKVFAKLSLEDLTIAASKCNCGGCSCSTCKCGGTKCMACGKGCTTGNSSYSVQSLNW
jgi:hypothetical protein